MGLFVAMKYHSLAIVENSLAGDLNGDFKVDFVDFALMVSQWGEYDLIDLALLAGNWLIDCNPNPSNPAGVYKYKINLPTSLNPANFPCRPSISKRSSFFKGLKN